MTGRRLVATAIACVPLVGSAPMSAAPPEELSALLERADRYVLNYENRFAIIISDEHSVQVVRSGGLYSLGNDSPSISRTLDSEMLHLWIPEQHAWLSTRNVLKVDGQLAIGSRHRLEQLLASGAPVDVASLRRLRAESTRFNLGSIRQDFDDQMLPLHFLERGQQARFSFTAAADESIDHVVTHKVKFDERTRPTIIQERGVDRPSRGLLWIADDGAVWRTQLDGESAGTGGSGIERLDSSVTVQYRQDARLATLVPVRMRATYQAVSVGGDFIRSGERIECEATYSNFRRFETPARIVPK